MKKKKETKKNIIINLVQKMIWATAQLYCKKGIVLGYSGIGCARDVDCIAREEVCSGSSVLQ